MCYSIRLSLDNLILFCERGYYMNIIVDGDACPVISEVIDCAQYRNCVVTIVRSYHHYTTSEYPSFVTIKYVDDGPDAVDFEIVKNSLMHDIVITQDYGLASLLLNKNVIVVHHTGLIIDHDNIDRLLIQRYESAKIRRQHQKSYIKGPKKLTTQDKNMFKKKLLQIIERYEH